MGAILTWTSSEGTEHMHGCMTSRSYMHSQCLGNTTLDIGYFGRGNYICLKGGLNPVDVMRFRTLPVKYGSE
jgi:hypothetical protein